ncbi:MAG: prepilin-type N-terminal cleavage/methylation domain-containing protein [Candidatus Liptonbacteria bacterium]|nr:prepilin-type N-terminal cleavage/methylation domain-containing protein [Candidatus Liptonbacteria bacterium]
MISNFSSRRGFTLLEILLVVAALGILAGIVILAINPGKQLGDTRNAARKVDVNTIINGVYQYSLDNNGNLPSGLSTSTCSTATNNICKTSVATSSCTGFVDLSVLTQNEKYLVSIPIDPSISSASTGTGYFVRKTVNGRVEVCAPNAEQGATVSVIR